MTGSMGAAAESPAHVEGAPICRREAVRCAEVPSSDRPPTLPDRNKNAGTDTVIRTLCQPECRFVIVVRLETTWTRRRWNRSTSRPLSHGARSGSAPLTSRWTHRVQPAHSGREVPGTEDLESIALPRAKRGCSELRHSPIFLVNSGDTVNQSKSL